MLEEDGPVAAGSQAGHWAGLRRRDPPLLPAEADAPAQPRNAAICLRPYRTSLSLSCRAAVTAQVH